MENSLAAPVLISKYYMSANIIGGKVMTKKKKKVGKMQKNRLKRLIDCFSMYFLHLKEC